MLRVSILGIVVLIIMSISPCMSRDSQSIVSSDDSIGGLVNDHETVAILPWICVDGTPGAQRAAKEFLETSLKKSLFFREDSFNIIPETKVILAWTQELGHDFKAEETKRQSPKELLKLGEKLGADWVISGHATWRTRSVWIGLGPKTKSDCTVDMLIVDVKKKELSLDAREVKMDNAPKENPIRAATTIILGVAGAKGLFSSALPLSFVSGGPKTPSEINAAQSSIAKAIRPWLALHPRNRKIVTVDENEIK